MNKFFGRQEHLETLQKRIASFIEGYRQNIAMIGDEFIGKTSLLHRFLDKFCDNNIVIVYLEVRPDSLDSFARRFIGVLLYNFLINSGIPLKEDLDYLIKNSRRYIPDTVDKIKPILALSAKNKKNTAFYDLLALCDSFSRETGKRCVVIFDEFHNLEYLGIKNLYRNWSKLLVLQKNAMYIITSSAKFRAKNILSKNLSLLFGNFQTLEIGPFDISSSRQYLADRLRGFELDRGRQDFIIDFSGGYPFYLEAIASALLEPKQENLTDTLEKLLFEPSGILNRRFGGYIKNLTDTNYSSDYLSILYLIASGRNKIKEIAHILHKQKKELILRVNRLLEFDLVTRNGDFLVLGDKVFGFWLRFVYQEKLSSLTHDAKNQKIRFRDNIEDLIQEFLSTSGKSVSERMIEILRLFEDEITQIEKKRVKLNHFREIKPLEFGGRLLKDGLLGRSQESVWIMAFKNDHLSEEDIAEFARECKKYRHKTQRKIIVTSRDIDANTRLKAMEEKIWAWDINNLNQILGLFSKPGVII